MATEAQIAANKNNAQKSTGPRSEAGKARSSRNARTHGLCSDDLILTCPEDEEFFQQRCDAIRRQYPVQHALIEHLVGTLAGAELQLRLIARVKRGAVILNNDMATDQLWGCHPLPKDEEANYEMKTRILGIAFLRDAIDKNAMGKFNRYEAEQHRIWHRAMRDIETLYTTWKDVEQQVPDTAENASESNPIPEPEQATEEVTPPGAVSNPEIKPKIAARDGQMPFPDTGPVDPPLPKAA